MKYLFIINDDSYGNECPYNALCLAVNLAKREELHLGIFLMGDGVQCATARQNPPAGFYNIEHMLMSIVQHGEVTTLGTCAQARGLDPDNYIDGISAGNLDLLGDWIVNADHILVF